MAVWYQIWQVVPWYIAPAITKDIQDFDMCNICVNKIIVCLLKGHTFDLTEILKLTYIILFPCCICMVDITNILI